MNPFDSASPFDARYYFADKGFYERLHPYVSELSQIRYLARVEAAWAEALADHGVCSHEIAAEIAKACREIRPEDVYEEEARIQHNIRALVNCIQRAISDKAKPYVHLFATSADIMDTARALCLTELHRAVIIPDLIALERKLIHLARVNADTPQMGRTHGQHAVPITFGFAVTQFVSRLGQRIEVIANAGNNLRGKFAGAVGAYNALSLLKPDNPAGIEASLMKKLGLRTPEVSTQVTQPEYVADYIYALASAWGVYANIADDFRHLQRSEIRELRDKKAADPKNQIVGSSTMPHKVNPKDFENVKSFWKAYVPRLMTVLMDQISEHQRDLTNSASMRFVTEFVAAFAYGTHRLANTLDAVEADAVRMQEVLDSGKDPVTAEPLYILLAMVGHPDGHEVARVLARDARLQKRSLADLVKESEEIQPYLKKMTPEHLAILADPAKYQGASAQRTRHLCDEWERKLAAIA
ncbi:MAG: lyase family protein [Gemmataceae bacterium]